jgi:hypothetical protein
LKAKKGPGSGQEAKNMTAQNRVAGYGVGYSPTLPAAPASWLARLEQATAAVSNEKSAKDTFKWIHHSMVADGMQPPAN